MTVRAQEWYEVAYQGRGGKTVASVRLHTAGAVPIRPGTPSLHVFAAGIG
jgi:hypothetical protein